MIRHGLETNRLFLKTYQYFLKSLLRPRWMLLEASITIWASLIAQLVKNLPAIQETLFDSWVGKFLWRRAWWPTPVFLPGESTPVFLGFPGGSDSKESACNAGDPSSVSGSGRSPGEGSGSPLQYSWPGEPQGQKSLLGPSPWSCKELNTTEWLILSLSLGSWRPKITRL